MDIPPVWTEVLGIIQQVDPRTVLAGGAVRDLDNGRPVKDLDIFVQPGFDYEKFKALWGGPREVRFFDSVLVESVWPLVSESIANYLSLTDVRQIWGAFLDIRAPPIQIIELSRPMSDIEILERLDFGLCQVGFNGRYVFNTMAYRTDKDNKTFTLCRVDDDKGARSRRRAGRLSDKYRDFRFIFPNIGES